MIVVDKDLPSDVVAALSSESVVAVDTETSGLDWRRSELQVCQLYSTNVGAIVLRNVTDPPRGLATVLENPEVTKVFHFAPFDLRFLLAHWRVNVQTVACTKAASKLLRPQADATNHSLAQLAAQYAGVTLDKGAVRTSDWGTPTLSEQQLAYAVADVQFLPKIFAALLLQLTRAGMSDVFEEVCRYMPIDAQLDVVGIPNPLTY